MTILPLVEQQ